MRRVAAPAFAVLALLAPPAQALQTTALAAGGFEHFFAAPLLDIRGSGDLDLTGLSFIEGVEGGFRIGASFNLDWMGGERAALATPASTWSGLDGPARGVSIVSGGNLDFGRVRIGLAGGTILLSANGIVNFGEGSVIDVAQGSVILVGGSGATTLQPGGDLRLVGSPTNQAGGGFSAGGNLAIVSPTPIPEPGTPALLLAGLLGLAGFAFRGASAGR